MMTVKAPRTRPPGRCLAVVLLAATSSLVVACGARTGPLPGDGVGADATVGADSGRGSDAKAASSTSIDANVADITVADASIVESGADDGPDRWDSKEQDAGQADSEDGRPPDCSLDGATGLVVDSGAMIGSWGVPGSCPLGSVSFHMIVQEEGWTVPITSITCPWLGVSCGAQTIGEGAPAGGPYFWPPAYAPLDCRDCATFYPSANGCGIVSIPDGGEAFDLSWSGAYFTTLGSCASNTFYRCMTPLCAPAGRFVAHMCACAPLPPGGTSSCKTSCADVPFDYPATGVVVGVVR
jgi:hypothetical protein